MSKYKWVKKRQQIILIIIYFSSRCYTYVYICIYTVYNRVQFPMGKVLDHKENMVAKPSLDKSIPDSTHAYTLEVDHRRQLFP